LVFFALHLVHQYLFKAMKRLFITLLITSCFFASSGQEVIRQQSCNSPELAKQADSLKQLLARDGFELMREASMTMESGYEMPVIFPLQQGTWYHFVFIGEATSKLYEVRMFDNNEKQVIYQKKLWGDIDGNVISFSYVPQFSEFHMMRPVQENKKQKKNLCGYVMMFRKVKK